MSEPHSELRNITRAYAGFQMATALFIVASANSVPLMAFILPLFAVSIPSTIAYAGLARLTPEDEARNPNPISAISQLLAYIPSLIAISLILWPVSPLAALVFLATAAVWVIAIVRLRTRQTQGISP
jgi:hypothetical protein